MVKNRIIFIMPPKDWFYGIDYANSERIIKYFQDNNIFEVYKFKDIDIFFKNKLQFKDFLKLVFFYFYFKFKKQKYVFAINSSYIAYCNLVFKNQIINFFSQILKIKCILKWDHLNEQVPNIVERVLEKSQFSQIDDYKKFFLEKIDNKNFIHYTWQKDNYFCKNDFIENTLDLKSFNLKKLNYFFTFDIKKKNFLKKNDYNRTIALIGYINKISQPNLNLEKISLIFNNKKNFFKKKYYKNLVDYSNYEYSKNKIDLLKIKNLQFHGINLIENTGQVVTGNDFYSEISKFFIIINPVNPISLTITPKFYLIYLSGGFCIHELPSEIPPKLDKFKEFIFYKNKKELITKIEFLKNNLSVYLSIKKEINEISKSWKINSLKVFTDEFLRKKI